jgi:hypothetical protein
MSMLFDLRRVPKEQADSLLQDPSDIVFVLYGSEPDTPPKGFFQKVFGQTSPPKRERPWSPPAEGTVFELEKNWHILHYVLARSPWEGPMPQATLIRGGTELGTVDVGYGPARMLDSQEIEQFLSCLRALDRNEFAAGITGAELESQEIYGAYPDWGREDADNLWAYIEGLQAFFAQAQAQEESIIMYLY